MMARAEQRAKSVGKATLVFLVVGFILMEYGGGIGLAAVGFGALLFFVGVTLGAWITMDFWVWLFDHVMKAAEKKQ